MEAKSRPEGIDDAGWTRYVNTYTGGAHSVLGRVLMLQEKTTAAIPELQEAMKLLEGNDQALAPVLYFLGFAYAKERRHAEARTVLNEAVKIGGPYAAPSQEILRKIRGLR